MLQMLKFRRREGHALTHPTAIGYARLQHGRARRGRLRAVALIVYSLGAAGLLAASAAAQLAQQTQDPLAQRLAHLGEEADTLAHSLPSFTCTESVQSQELHGRKVVRGVRFTATLRAQRDAEGKLRESFDLETVDGAPWNHGAFSIPAYVEGGFSRALRYFAPAQQACYRYTLSPDAGGSRIDFVAAPHLPPDNACTTEGTRGFALLDAQGNVTHLERSVSPRYSRLYREAPFASIDFAPVPLNGVAYPLSRHIVAELSGAGSTGRFEAQYSACKLFTATVTIHPGPNSGETPDSLPH